MPKTKTTQKEKAAKYDSVIYPYIAGLVATFMMIDGTKHTDQKQRIVMNITRQIAEKISRMRC